MRSNPRWWRVFGSIFGVWKRGRRLPRSLRTQRRKARRVLLARSAGEVSRRRQPERLAIQPLESRLALAGDLVVEPVSYSMINGGSASYHYWDDTYNGAGNPFVDSSSLSGGLGQLTDGHVGVTNWQANLGHGNAYEWVGWRNTNPQITFDFGASRRIDDVRIHANNDKVGGVNLFASATIEYSDDSVNWQSFGTYVTSTAERNATAARFVDVGGSGEGRFARVTLNRQADWIFISEIQFHAFSTSIWTGRGDGVQFQDPANWMGGLLPEPGDQVTIDGDAGSTPVVLDGDVSGLDINASRPLLLQSGTVSDSRIDLTGSATLLGGGWNTWETGTLQNVTLSGAADLSGASGRSLNVEGTLTLDGGTIVLGNRFGTTLNRLLMHGTTSIDGTGEVIFGSSWQNAIVAMGSVAADSGQPIVDTFTVGAGVTIHGNAGWIGDDVAWPVAKIVNLGSVLGDAAPEPDELPFGDFATGGDLGNNDNYGATVDRSGVADPLPEASYRSVRWNNPSFTLPGLVPGATYGVRLHFAELWNGDRRQNVFINGVKVLDDVSIADAAGGMWKAVAWSFDTVADADGRIVVSVQGTSDNGQISAIEVFDGATRVLLSDCGLVPGTVTLAASRSLENEGTLGAASGGSLVVHGALASSGTVAVATGSTLSLTDSIANSGVIKVAGGGTLQLSGTVTSSGLGTVVSSGEVVLQGTIDNVGQTLTLDATTGSWRLTHGSRIVGGRVRLRDGATLLSGDWNPWNSGVLTDVTLDGVLDLGRESWRAIVIENTLTLENGAQVLLGDRSGTAGGRLLFVGRGTMGLVGDGEVIFGGDFQGRNQIAVFGSVNVNSGDPITDTFLIGAGVTIHGNRGWIGEGDQTWPVASIVNQGTILGDAAPEPGGQPYGDFATTGDVGFNDNGWWTVDRSGVTDALPEASYRTIRWGAPSFSLPGLAPGGTYTVRLHFAELWNSARRENVFINGVKVVDDVSIADAAGGMWKAVAWSFDAVADADGQIVVSVQGTNDNGQISAIEVFDGATRVLLSDCGLVPGTVTVGATRSLVNEGLFGAADGGTLAANGPLSNGGEITVSAGSVFITNAPIENTGSISGSGNAIFSLGAVTNEGEIVLSDGASLDVGGPAFTNSGSVSVSNALLFLHSWVNSGAISADRGGRLFFLGGGVSSGSIDVSDSTLYVDGTWTNSGTIVVTEESIAQLFGTWTNAGVIVASFTSGADLQGTWTNAGSLIGTDNGQLFASGTWTNAGTISLDRASLAIFGNTWSTAGEVIIGQDSYVSSEGDYVQTAGTTTLAGGLLASGKVSLQGGTLAGFGTVEGDLVNAATILPGSAGEAGTISVHGSYAQTAVGRLDLDIFSDAAFDGLFVTGDAALAGTLAVATVGTYAPSEVGRRYGVLSFAAASGAFDTLLGAVGGANPLFTLDTTGTGAALVSTRTMVTTPTVAASFAPSGDGVALSGRITGSGALPYAATLFVDDVEIGALSLAVDGSFRYEFLAVPTGVVRIRVRDADGGEVMVAVGRVSVQALDGGLAPLPPAVASILQARATVGFDAAGDSALFTVDLVAGRSATVSVTPPAAGRVRVELVGPDGTTILATRQSLVGGMPVILQTVAATATGRHTIRVTSLAGEATADLRLLLDTALEAPAAIVFGDGNAAAVQSIDGSALPISSTADRLAVVGMGQTSAVNVAAGKTVTAVVGGFAGNDLSTVVDGTSLGRGTDWTTGTVWWFGTEPTMEIALGHAFLINRASIEADNNDTYLIQYRDPATGAWWDWWEVPNYAGRGVDGLIQRPDTGGTETAESVPLSPVIADTLRVRATGGDGSYSVSELKVWGVPVSAATADVYAFTATAGQPTTVMLASTTGALLGGAALEMVDGSGNVVAVGTPASSIGGVRISGFVPSQTGTYRVRVSGVIGEYDVSVVRGAAVPSAPGVSLTKDTGRDPTDLITSDGRITVSGVEAGAVVSYSTDGGATWGDTFQPLEGTNTVLVRQANAVGIASEATTFVFTLDTSRPAAPVARLVTDTGSRDSDGVTSLAELTMAAQIATLFHTGVDETGSVAANGTIDLHYTLVSVPGDSSQARVATNDNGWPIGAWFGDNGTSAWIGPDNDSSLDGPGGYYVYRTTFDLGSLSPAGARIDGLWSTDDPGFDILINGTSLGFQNWTQYVGFTPFTIDSGFVPGVNTIDFVVYNGGGPTGLRVEMTGTSSTVESGATVEYSSDGGATWASEYLPVEGTNTVLVRQIDVAGNVSDPFTVAFTLDTQAAAPGVGLANDTGPSASDLVTKDGTLSLTGIEADATVSYSTDGGTTWADVFLAVEGANTVLVRQTDPAGNVSPATTFSFTRDTSVPVTPGVALANDTGSSDSDAFTRDGAISLSGVEAGAAVEYSIDGGKTWTGSFQVVEGKNSVLVRQMDLGGNVSDASSALVFTLDTQAAAPGVSLATDTGTSATDGITSVGTLALSGIEKDASVEYSIDGGKTWSDSFTAVEGKNSVQLRQRDLAGNVSGASSALVFTLDTVAPAAPGVSLANDTGASDSDLVTNDASLALSDIESGATVGYSVDGGVTWSSVFHAVEGKNALLVRQVDRAGNVSAATSFSFVRDTTAPVAPGVALANDTGASASDGITSDGSLALSAVEAGARVEYSTDGGTTWGTKFQAVEGVNSVLVRQVDVAGNVTIARPAVITSPSLLAVYRFDDPANLGSDSSGRGLDAFNYGVTAAASGYQNGAASFDGGSFVRVPLDVRPDTLPRLTWGAWVKPSAANPIRTILGSDDGGYDRELNVDSRGGTTSWSAFTGQGVLASGVAPDTTDWVFVAAVYDESQATVTLWVGDRSVSAPTAFGSSNAFFDIGHNPGFGEFFSGLIDNVFVYGDALSPQQIADLRSYGFPGADSSGPGVAATKLAFTLDTKAAAPGVALSQDTGSKNDDLVTSVGTLSLTGVETGAVVEYSIDGGKTWTGSFTAAEGKNSVQVRQVDLAGNVSAATTLAFTLDTQTAAPGLSLTTDTGTSATDGITSVGTLALSGVEKDASVEYSIDGGKTWTGSFQAAEGKNSVQVRQIDLAGNVSAGTTLVFTLDTKAAAPGVSLTTDTGRSATDGITSVGTLALSGVEKDASVEYSIDGGKTWTGSFQAAEGKNSVQVRQRDLAGNVSDASVALEFTLDTQVPAAPGSPKLTSDTGSSTTDGITSIGTLSLSGVEKDASVEYSIDGGKTWTGSFTAVDGKNSVQVRQKDLAGNVSGASAALVFTLDTAALAPVVALVKDTGASATDRITTDGRLSVTGLETGAVVEYSVDKGATWTSAFTAALGANSVQVRQTDPAGNVSPGATFDFTLVGKDVAAPTVALTKDTGSSATDKITSDGRLALGGLVTGAVVEYSVDGGVTWAKSFQAVEGVNTVQVRQTDLGGSVSASASLTFTLDTQAAAPAVALTTDTGQSATDGITSKGALTVVGVESKAVVQYSTDGGANWKTSFTAVEGANTVQVRQIDVAGNVSSATTFAVTLDTKIPATPGVTLAADTGSKNNDLVTSNGALALTGIEAKALVEYSVDGGKTWAPSFSPVEGKNTVQVRQSDVAGNVSATKSITFTLDTQAAAPVVSLASDTGASVTDRITSKGTLSLGGVESGAKVEYSVNDGKSWGASFTAVEGANAVRARQTDAAGNVSSPSDPFLFTLDTKAPAALGISLTSDTGVSATDRRSRDGRLTVTGVETGATASFSTDGGKTWFTTPEVPEGSFTSVQARQTDVAGNVSVVQSLGATVIKKSIALPVLSLVSDTGASPTDRITQDGTTAVANVETGALVQYSIDGGTTWTTSFKAREGVNSVLVRQSDDMGNVSTAAPFVFTVDTKVTPPVAALTVDSGWSPSDSITNNAAISAAGTEPGAAIEYSTDGGNAWKSSFVPVVGTNIVTIRQVDVAGNVSDVSNTVVFTFDPYGAYVTGRSLDVEVGQFLDALDVTFSEAVPRLRAADVSLLGPGGPLAVGTPVLLSGTTWRVPFTPLPDVGWYTFTILTSAADVAGNPLDQNGDGVPGGPDDAYVTPLHVAFADAAPLVWMSRDGLRVTGSFSDPGAGQTWTATVDPGDGWGDRPLALLPDGSFAFDLASAAFADVTVKVTDNHGFFGTATVARAVSVTLSGADVAVAGSEFDDTVTLSVDADGYLRHDLPVGGALSSPIDFDSALPGVQSILASAATSITIAGGAGADRLDASALSRGVTLQGGVGDDALVGSSGDDTIEGGAGNDSIDAGAGDDSIDAGTGANAVVAGAGDDRVTVLGTSGVDVFSVVDDAYTLGGIRTTLSGVNSLRFVSGGGADSIAIAPALPFPVVVSGIAPTVEARREGSTIIGRVVGSFVDPGDLQSWTATIDPGDGLGPRTLPLAADQTFRYDLPDRPVTDIAVTVTDDEGNAGGATIAVAGVNRFVAKASASWSDPANWSLGHVPVAGADEVTWIPAGVVATIEGDTTVGPLRCRGTLEIRSGTATFVSDTVIAGTFVASPGVSLVARGPGVSLVTAGTAAIDGVELTAADGGALRLGGVTGFDAGSAARRFRASGAGSVLDLPDLVSVVAGPSFALEASAGGRIAMGSLAAASGGLAVSAVGGDAAVVLPALVTWDSSASVGLLDASGGGQVDFGEATPLLLGVSVAVVPTGTFAAGALRLGAGSLLSGTGTAPSIVNLAGTVRPAGSGIGALTIDGDFTQAADGRLEIDLLSLTNSDRLLVAGRASVGGTVRLVHLAEPTVKIGDGIEAISFASTDGTTPAVADAEFVSAFGPLTAKAVVYGKGIAFCFPIVVTLESADPATVVAQLAAAVAQASALDGTVAIAIDTSKLGVGSQTLKLDQLPSISGTTANVVFAGPSLGAASGSASAAAGGLTIVGSGGVALTVGAGASGTISGITLAGFGSAATGALANAGTLSLVNCVVDPAGGTSKIVNSGTLYMSGGSIDDIVTSASAGPNFEEQAVEKTVRVKGLVGGSDTTGAGGFTGATKIVLSKATLRGAIEATVPTDITVADDAVVKDIVSRLGSAGGFTGSTKISLSKATLTGKISTDTTVDIALGDGAVVSDIESLISGAGGFTGSTKISLSKATLTGAIRTNAPAEITLGEGAAVNDIVNTIDATIGGAGGFTGSTKISLSKATLGGSIRTNAPAEIVLGEGSSVASILNDISSAGGFTGSTKISLSKASLTGGITSNATIDLAIGEGSTVAGGVTSTISSAGGFTGSTKISLSKATLTGAIRTNLPAEISVGEGSSLDAIENIINTSLASAGGFTTATKIVVSKATLSGRIATNAPVDLSLDGESVVAGDIVNALSSAGGFTGSTKISLSKATLGGSILTNAPAEIVLGDGAAVGGAIVNGLSLDVAKAANAAGGFTTSTKISLSKATITGGISTNVPVTITLDDGSAVGGDIVSAVEKAIASAGGFTGSTKISLSKATLGGSIFAYAPTDIDVGSGSEIGGIVNQISAAGGFTTSTKISLSKATLSGGISSNAPAEIVVGDETVVAGDILNVLGSAGGFTGSTKISLSKATLGGGIYTDAPADISLGAGSVAREVFNLIDAAGGFTTSTKISLSKASLTGDIRTNAPATIDLGDGARIGSLIYGVTEAVAKAAAAGGFTGSTKISLSKAALGGTIAVNVPVEIALGAGSTVDGDIVNVIEKSVAAAGGFTGSTKISLSKATLGGTISTNAAAEISLVDGSAVANIRNAIDGAGGFTGSTKISLSKATLGGILVNLAPADISIADDSVVNSIYHKIDAAGGFTSSTKIVLSKASLTGILELRSDADVTIGQDSVVATVFNAVAGAGGFTTSTKISVTKATVTGRIDTRSPAEIALGEGAAVRSLYADMSSAGGFTGSTKISLSKATISGTLESRARSDIQIGEGSSVGNIVSALGAAGGFTGSTKISLSKATVTGTLANSVPAEITIGAGSTVKNLLNTVDGALPPSPSTITVTGATITGSLQNEAPAVVRVNGDSTIRNLINTGTPVAGWTSSTLDLSACKILGTFSNIVTAAITLNTVTFVGLVSAGTGAGMTIDVASSTFAYLVNSGTAVGRIRVTGSTFQSVQNDGDDVALLSVAGGAEPNTLVNNGNRVTLTFAGNGGDDVFVNNGAMDTLHGRAVAATVDLGAGRDRAVLGGTFVAGSSVAGGAGDDGFLFAGDVSGTLSLSEAANLDADTVDFSSLSSNAGIAIDLASTAAQTVRAGLTVTLSSATGFENAVGSSGADTIRGNARANVLRGADPVDDRQAAGAAWNGRTQVVYLDFDTQTNTATDKAAERIYTATDRIAIRSAVQAAYAGFPVSVVNVRPAGGDFVTVLFNLTREDGEPGGDSSEIDFGNRNLGGEARVQVNGLLGLPGYPEATTANWIAASAWIAAHEVGHLMGLRHADSFGPPGFGIHAPPGGSGKSVSDVFAGNFIDPPYDGPSGAWETNVHMLATAALTGFTAWDAVGPTFFGEREGVKLAYAAAAAAAPDGRLLVAEQSGVHDALTVAGSQPLQPVSLDVPNSLSTGLNAGKSLFAAAVSVAGRLEAGGKDVYRFDGRAGDLWNLQVMSTALKRLGSDSFDATLKIYDATGTLLTTSDDEFESQDPSVIDFTLPADGTYYAQITVFDDPAVATDGQGGAYEFFAWRFDTANRTDGADTLEGRAGDDLLEGGLGDDTYVFAGTALGSDVVREDARLVRSGTGNPATADGRDAHDRLDFRSFGAAVTIDLSSNAAQTVAAGNLVLRLSSARDVAGEPAVSAAIEDVLGSTTLANTFTANARSNTFVGGSAADTFRFTSLAKPATAVDSVTAGGGVDTLDFGVYATGITLDLAATAKAQSLAGKNSLRLEAADVENVVGTAFRDVISGNPLDNTFWGLAGNDSLVGGAGADILLGGAGDDSLNGGVGNDMLVGGAGADTLLAGGGNDIVIGGEFTGDRAGTPWTSLTLLRQILADWGSTRKFDAYLAGASVVDTEKDTITVGVGLTWVIVSSSDVITDGANFVETVSNPSTLTSPGDKKTTIV